MLTMFLAPCAVGGAFVLVFAARLRDRRLDPAERKPWSLRELAGSFYVDPRRNPDFAWAFASRFFFVTAYAFLVTYQAYYLLDELGSAEDDVPHQIFLGTLVQSAALVITSPIAGRLSDWAGRRKVFVALAAVVYAARATARRGCRRPRRLPGRHGGRRRRASGCTWPSTSPSWSTCSRTVVRSPRISASSTSPARCPFAIAPAVAPVVLAVGGGSYSVLYAVAAGCAVVGALAILPIRRVRVGR